MNTQILVLDFGSQYTQLIARRLREYGVYTEIVPYFEKPDSIKLKNPKGIILSGGPASVYEKDAYKPDSAIFTLGIPILGICYGMHLIAQHFGGKVIKADAQEFGKAVLEIMESHQEFNNLNDAKYANILSHSIEFAPNLTISLANKEDLKEILTLQKIAFVDEAKRIGGMDIPPLTQDLKSIKKEFETHTFLKCTLKGKIIGSVRGYKDKGTTYLSKLFVDCAYRQKGIATALIKAFCAALPAQRYELFTSEKSTENIALYEKLGFVEYKREKPKGFPLKAVFLEKRQSIYANILSHSIEFAPNLTISLAQKEDLKEILALQKTAFIPEAKRVGHLDIKPLRQDLKSLEKEFKKLTFIKCVAENGRIVGVIRGYNDGNSTYIYELFVDDEFSGRGIAKNLVYALESALPAKRYEIFTSINSVENIKRYEKIGYKQFKIDSIRDKNNLLEMVFLEKVCKTNPQNQSLSPQISSLFANVAPKSIVWMSHADKVESIPQGFKELAKSGNTHYCAIADFKRNIYALQFHPEVVHSECGGQMLKNFAVGICGSDTSWNMKNFAQNEIIKLREIVGIKPVAEDYPTFTTFRESSNKVGKTQAIQRLLAIWEDSVRATQEVSEEFIAHRRKEIEKDYILKVEEILIYTRADEWLGFIALKDNEITLLFIAPQHFGKGIGKALLREAFKKHLHCFERIILNSRKHALGFYQHLGFTKTREKPFFAGATGKVRLIPLSITHKNLQKSLGFEGASERVRCDWARDKDAVADRLYKEYHDTEWGEPLHDDKKLFEFLLLEGFQAGLSWITILKKREAFCVAFDNFDYRKIAKYNEAKVESLMQNSGIIRNRLKIEGAILNAKAFLAVQREFGSFDKYIWGFVGGNPIINHFKSIADLPASTPLSDKISKDLKKRGFKFVGSTIVYAFMQAVGMVNDHLTSCFKRHSACGDSSLTQSLNDCSSSARSFASSKLPSSHFAKHSNLTQDTRIAEYQADSVKSQNAKWGQDFGDKNGALRDEARELPKAVMTEAEAKQSPFLAKKPTPSKVLCAVSGGVDSSVVAALLYRAIGENLIPVFVDTGLLRKGEREAVEKMFKENLKVPLIVADASKLFLSRLKGVLDPEKKRKIIGETFIEVFEKEAKKHNAKGEIKFLAQGTLYPDVIESVSVKGPSKTIKSHHNVGGLPEWMKFELIEPLRELFKDEVRALGRELGMPESMLMRHPFPGPGLAIRIMGEVNKADLALLREADSIFIEELHKAGLYNKVWQAFCVLLNVRSVGVMGDNRTYDNTICVRAVEAIDGMTATFAHLPHDFLESVSNRIINEVEGINRVVYDITSKPPGTIEWE